MIRSMQVRLNSRTKVYGEFYPELEQAPEPTLLKDKKKQSEMKMIKTLMRAQLSS